MNTYYYNKILDCSMLNIDALTTSIMLIEVIRR